MIGAQGIPHPAPLFKSANQTKSSPDYLKYKPCTQITAALLLHRHDYIDEEVRLHGRNR